MRLSWNRDDDGVITVYATMSDGRCLPVADFWLKPWIEHLSVTRQVALSEQERLAMQLVSTFNQSFKSGTDGHKNGHSCPIGDEACAENCGSYGCRN